MAQGLVWTYTSGEEVQQNVGPKYDMVFLIGPDTQVLEVERLLTDSQQSGLRICIIGDGGEESFLSKEFLQQQLTGKIDANTSINISGHGGAKKVGKNDYTPHKITMYPESKNETYIILNDLKEIFESDIGNKDKKMMIGIFACQAGAVAEDVPDNISAIIHGGKKYYTETSMSLDTMCHSITRRINNKNIADQCKDFMHAIVHSPETATYTENDESFTVSASREPLCIDLEKHLRWQLTKFLKFMRDELNQEVGSDKDIAKMVKDFPISEDTLKRYNELALLLECDRSNKSEHAEKYIYEYIEKGTDINTAFTNGYTPLNTVCEKGNISVFEALIKAGADVNKATHSGITPFWNACRNGNLRMVNVLFDKEADYNSGIYNTFTPLMAASMHGQQNVVAFLLNKITDIDILKKTFDIGEAEKFCKNNNLTAPELASLHGDSALDMADNPEIAEMIRNRIEELSKENNKSSTKDSYLKKIIDSEPKTIKPEDIKQQIEIRHKDIDLTL
ncbi:MAG: uncharacterized protein K0R98_6 [Rickettsiaceae bacterium]|jgi:hypothetical protein|nr:uncharacterized protein [Rickettsiaceae bacterium]